MTVQVKKFNFLPFEEWDKVKDCHYKEKLGKYNVEISRFFPTVNYYHVSANFPMNEIDSFNFDSKQDMSSEDQLESFKAWYEEACVKVNEEFKNYIYTYIVEES
jgi:hypothetical protein